jgi:hypothetical protein
MATRLSVLACREYLNNKDHLLANIRVEIWHDTITKKIEC